MWEYFAVYSLGFLTAIGVLHLLIKAALNPLRRLRKK